MPLLGGFPSEYCYAVWHGKLEYRHPLWYGKTRMVLLPNGEKFWRYVYSFWHDPRKWQTPHDGCEDYRLGDPNFVGLLIYCSFEFQSLSGLCNCCDCFFQSKDISLGSRCDRCSIEYISDDRLSFGPAHMDEIWWIGCWISDWHWCL